MNENMSRYTNGTKETVSWLKISIVIWFFSIMLIIITSLVKLNNICCCLRDFYSTLLLP